MQAQAQTPAAASHGDAWSLEEDDVATVSFDAARAHDAFWEEAHAGENYYRPGLDYEDYAPAYCVGYVGHAQYAVNRGDTFEDAEKSLLSNWVRIKGDSRLSLQEAQMAIRAAWDHAAFVASGEQTHSAHLDVGAPLGAAARKFLESANAWLDRALGTRPPAHTAPHHVARRGHERVRAPMA